MVGLRDGGGGSLRLSRALATTLAAIFTVAFLFLIPGGAAASPESSGHISGAEAQRAAQHSLQIGMAGTGSGTVTSSVPAGAINCHSGATDGCIADIDERVRVQLDPEADEGSVFTGWSGVSARQVCASTEIAFPRRCAFAMPEGGVALIANFARLIPGQLPVAVFKEGNGEGTVTSNPSGIDCGPECPEQTENFPRDASVTLTAQPAEGMNFIDWGNRGACIGATSTTCTVTVSEARSVYPVFTLKRHDLTVVRSGDGSGTVTSDPAGIDCGSACFAEFDHGTTVTLTAAPRPGSAFTGWSGVCSGEATTCVVKMEQARVVGAGFGPQPDPPGPVAHRLTVTSSASGSGRVTSSPVGIDCGTVCAAHFEDGTRVSLTAKPDSGSAFTGWSGACAGTAATCEVTMSEARTVTATFDKAADEVPVNPPDNGTAIYDPVTGKLKIRLKCASHYRPKCLKMIAQGVTGKKRKAKKLTGRIKVRNRKAGKWKHATLVVKPKFRRKVEDMGRKTVKTLWVRIKLTYTKKKKVKVGRNGKVRKVKLKVKKTRTIHHRYRVLVRR